MLALIVGAAILIKVTGIVRISGVTAKGIEEAREEAFRPHLGEYLSRDGLTDASAEGKPYIAGRLVAIDVPKQKVAHDVLTWLPGEIRAESHAEVGTVVWVDCHEQQGASYEIEGQPDKKLAGLVSACTVTIIDRGARKIVGRTTILGEQSEVTKLTQQQVESDGAIVSERPLGKVVDHLKALPRR
ncbi:MAG: hypothetical protein HYV09_01265 [Deltaproteobacteria bacterium]|nr:hypothetical protein [Deltaproteobacteria bacterium]